MLTILQGTPTAPPTAPAPKLPVALIIGGAVIVGVALAIIASVARR